MELLEQNDHGKHDKSRRLLPHQLLNKFLDETKIL